MTKITISDEDGNKKTFDGSIEGFVIKKPTIKYKKIAIKGLDDSWGNKRVLCVLIDCDKKPEKNWEEPSG